MLVVMVYTHKKHDPDGTSTSSCLDQFYQDIINRQVPSLLLNTSIKKTIPSRLMLSNGRFAFLDELVAVHH